MSRLPLRLALALLVVVLTGSTLASRSAPIPVHTTADLLDGRQSADTTFSDRRAVLETIATFYVGDHTGSAAHKAASMHPQGAYRYVNEDGEYRESTFRLDESRGDTLYTEELLSVEIYEHVALARLRLDNQRRDEAEYKLMTLHKAGGRWLITGISWGWGVTL